MSSCAIANQGDLDPAVLGASFRGVVRGDWVGIPKTLGRQQVRVHPPRPEVGHHGVGGGLIERGLMRLDTERHLPRLFFTEAGVGGAARDDNGSFRRRE